MCMVVVVATKYQAPTAAAAEGGTEEGKEQK